jgi:hypothetical protein
MGEETTGVLVVLGEESKMRRACCISSENIAKSCTSASCAAATY